ncbi:MAG: class I SAM-dependent methyltransferase [Acidobacteriota bacterium]
MTRGLAFVLGTRAPDYGWRLSCLRWKRAAHADVVVECRDETPAQEALAGADSWVIVREPTALPIPGRRIPEPPYGRVLLAQAAAPAPPSFVHTLRELEGARLEAADPATDARAAALAFWREDFPPAGRETIRDLYQRFLGLPPQDRSRDSTFRVIRFGEPSERERPELTRRLPDLALRILDVGCGAGGGISSASPRRGPWRVTGIEKEPGLARQARTRCDRVVEGDLREVLPRMARDGERFDALVFADVLEHLEDPVEALRAARPLADSGACLLASVPNVGHLSVLRDLLAGRFDPVPAGLLDAGHLRWFTRESLAQTLEEAGWRVLAIGSEPGAPSPDPQPLRALAESWADGDAAGLATYQWIAEAVAP